MTTLASFRTQVAAKMGLDNTASSADRALMLLWANSGYAEVLSAGRFKIAPANMTFTAGTGDYTLPTQALAINEVYVTTASTTLTSRLERVTAQQIMDRRIAESSGGVPPARYYALNGANLLMVYPTPTSSLDSMTMYYVPRPTPLSADGDSPSDVPEEHHKVIEDYMLWNAGQYVNDKFSRNGDEYRMLYEAQLAKLKKAALHMGGRRLAPAVVGRRRFVAAAGQDDGR